MATARVRVMLDIPSRSSWGKDCTAEQIFKQAADDVLGWIGNSVEMRERRAAIVGQPEVTMVLIPEKER